MTRLFPPTPPHLQGMLNRWQRVLRPHWQRPLQSFARHHNETLVSSSSVERSKFRLSQALRERTEPVASQSPLNHSGDAIAIQSLDKVFNLDQVHAIPALTDVTLSIPPGTVQMLMGPSGAGKTTLLLCLAGLLHPTVGTVTLLGQTLNELSLDQLEHFRRQYIGMVFQESNLLRSLTALENVEAMLQFRGVHGHAAHRQAQDLLDAVGLHTHLDHLPRHLSGGQQQRVSVARALAGYPPIILADEPTAALDFKTGHNVVEFMRHMAKDHGCTIVITTHDPRLLDVGDRVCHLNDGVLQNGVLQDGVLQDRALQDDLRQEAIG